MNWSDEAHYPIAKVEEKNMASKDWFLTHSGKVAYVLDPSPEAVCIEDIAWALSNLCRFGGHVKKFYSVAEHSIHMCHAVLHTPKADKRMALAALLHDATEAYLGDIITPIKRLLPNYSAIESRWAEVIQEVLGAQLCPLPLEVHYLDRVILHRERIDLMAGEDLFPRFDLYKDDVRRRFQPINPMPSAEARTEFLRLYHYLKEETA